MGTLRLNDCPRCRGTVIVDKDEYGWYEECLQCGYLRDLETLVEVERQTSPEGKKEKKMARAA